MGKLWPLVSFLLVGAWALAVGDAPAAEKKIRVLVVTGGHGYPVKPFRAVFDGYKDMECTFVDEKVGGEAYDDIGGWPYDAILLYNSERKLSDARRENFLKLLDRGVGLVILHHAIYGYRVGWPEYQKVVGVTSWLTGWKDNVDYKVHVEDPKHPITEGLADFAITDETYAGYKVDPNVHLLLTTDEPTNAKSLAWVHTYGKSPVCYLQLGHDEKAYTNKSFVTILGRAIRWSAGRLEGAGQAPGAGR